ncbi:MAG: GNAT family N-acetyltransferase [Candidatus Aenigmarchaeota archaeon]|nr:GNAT family N-acetyltransferase [Candidatus Aenigmarchaeota archaeon]
MIEIKLAAEKDRQGFENLAAERDKEIRQRRAKNYWGKKFTKLVMEKRLVISLDKGKPSGFLYFTFEFIDYPAAYVELIFVSKKSRRKGSALYLLNRFERLASENGFVNVFSSTNPSNRISLKLHKKLGYKECGFIYGIENRRSKEIFLSKELKKT